MAGTAATVALLAAGVSVGWVVVGGIAVGAAVSYLFRFVVDKVEKSRNREKIRLAACGLLGLPHDVTLDRNTIDRRFHAISLLIHPDRSTTKGGASNNEIFIAIKEARDLLRERL